MNLWLVRHAAVEGAHGLCYGRLDVRADVPATQVAAQALAAAVPLRCDVRTSPSTRCRQLADALETLRPDLRTRHDARLREFDFGHWEGRAWEAIGQDAMAAWTEDFIDHRPGGGESVRGLMRRVSDAFQQIDPNAGDVVWITHAGVIRAVRLLLQGQALPAAAADWPGGPMPFGGWEVHPLPLRTAGG
jgi:alpha-ribazole phosphatase